VEVLFRQGKEFFAKLEGFKGEVEKNSQKTEVVECMAVITRYAIKSKNKFNLFISLLLEDNSCSYIFVQ